MTQRKCKSELRQCRQLHIYKQDSVLVHLFCEMCMYIYKQITPLKSPHKIQLYCLLCLLIEDKEEISVGWIKYVEHW